MLQEQKYTDEELATIEKMLEEKKLEKQNFLNKLNKEINENMTEAMQSYIREFEKEHKVKVFFNPVINRQEVAEVCNYFIVNNTVQEVPVRLNKIMFNVEAD